MTTLLKEEPVDHVSYDIDRRKNLTKKEFLNEYVFKSKPVVITDSLKHWKHIDTLTPEFFKKNYGHITINIKGNPYRLGDYIDMMFTSTYDNPIPYPCKFDMSRTFPGLIELFKPHMLYGISDRINHPLMLKRFLKATTPYELFFGGQGSSFPVLHWDVMHMNTQVTQIYGDKEFIIYGPEQTAYLYPKADKPFVSNIDNALKPDYEKFPLFRNATALRVMVKQGETLFFPMGSWHTTLIHTPCITYGRTQLNATNWKFFSRDSAMLHKDQPLHFKLTKTYLNGLGKLMDAQEKVMKFFI